MNRKIFLRIALLVTVIMLTLLSSPLCFAKAKYTTVYLPKSATYEFGVGIDRVTADIQYSYNTKGLLKKMVWDCPANLNGSACEFSRKFFYDKKNRVVRTVDTITNESSSDVYEWKYSYDKKNRFKEVRCSAKYKTDKKAAYKKRYSTVSRYSYKKEGKTVVVKSTCTGDEWSESSKATYSLTFDKKKRVKKYVQEHSKTYKGSDETSKRKYTYSLSSKYDKYGNRTKAKGSYSSFHQSNDGMSYEGKGQKEISAAIKYNKNKCPVKVALQSKGSKSKETFKFKYKKTKVKAGDAAKAKQQINHLINGLTDDNSGHSIITDFLRSPLSRFDPLGFNALDPPTI